MIPSERIKAYAETWAKLADFKFKVGAVIYHGKYMIGGGCNQPRKTHPRSTNPYNTIHAELSAVLDASSGNSAYDLSRCSIYVHRITPGGKSALAKPCKWCEKLLEDVGIEDVYYSL